MEITVENFMSIRKATLKLDKGITVLTGPNGSGKSQLLIRIMYEICNSFPDWQNTDILTTAGYPTEGAELGSTTISSDFKGKALWRPSVRLIAWDYRSLDSPVSQPIKSFINLENGYGYSYNLNERYTKLYTRVVQIKHSYNDNPTKYPQWKTIYEEFSNAFNKQLHAAIDNTRSTLGVKLGDDSVSRFGTLSTGELEFLSLLTDLLTETDSTTNKQRIEILLIDEIESHLHPDLQKKFIDLVKNHGGDKYILIATHSPQIMLSVPPKNLLFLKRSSQTKPNENQIVTATSDHNVMKFMKEMYSGFSTDERHAKFFKHTNSFEIVQFAHEALTVNDTALPGETAKPSDPQITTFRAIISSSENILEYGAGKGRMLHALIGHSNLADKQYFALDDYSENRTELETFIDSNPTLRSARITVGTFSNVKPEDIKTIDLFLFANVMHELGPSKIIEILNTIYTSMKIGSTITILEVLDLPVGESKFVLFHEPSWLAFFDTAKKQGGIKTTSYTSPSHGGSYLLAFYAKKEQHIDFSFNNNDALKALEKEIDGMTTIIKEYIANPETTPSTKLAFHAHNLANATAYKQILSSS